MEYIKVNNKKIKIKNITSFYERFKSLRFVLDTISIGYYFPNKKGINTYFFCQKVNIYQVDKDNKILYCHLNTKSEKFIFRKGKVKDIYILPLFVKDYYKIGDIIEIEES